MLCIIDELIGDLSPQSHIGCTMEQVFSSNSLYLAAFNLSVIFVVEMIPCTYHASDD